MMQKRTGRQCEATKMGTNDPLLEALPLKFTLKTSEPEC